MPSRLLHVLFISLLLGLVSCSSKPADTASNPSAPSSTAATTSDQNASTQSGTTAGNAMSSPANQTPAATPEPAPQPVVVPAGTTLTIRLANSVGSKLSSPGDSFTGTLASSVVVDGNTVIPKRTPVRGTVVDAKPLGKFKGGALLELRLSSITVNGNERKI